MRGEVSNRGMSKMRLLPHWARRTSKDEIAWVRPLTLRQKLREFWGVGEDGSQLVEMAMVFPLFLVLLTGMASFGMALYNQQQLGLVAAQAVQAVSLDTSQISDPCKTIQTYVSSSLPTWTASKIQYSLTVYTSSSSYSFPSSGTATGTAFTCTSLNSDITPFEPIVLTVSYPYNWFPIMNWTAWGSTFKPTGNLTTTQAAMIQ